MVMIIEKMNTDSFDDAYIIFGGAVNKSRVNAEKSFALTLFLSSVTL